MVGCDQGKTDIYSNFIMNVSNRGSHEIPDDPTRFGVCQDLLKANLLKHSDPGCVKLSRSGERAVDYLQEEEDLGTL